MTASSVSGRQTGMRYARHCYKHLAGYVGVAVERALIDRGYLVRDDDTGLYGVTDAGRNWFSGLGIDPRAGAGSATTRRRFARVCLDNTERAPHLAGRLGDGLLGSLVNDELAVWHDDRRDISFTPAGVDFLRRELGIAADPN